MEASNNNKQLTPFAFITFSLVEELFLLYLFAPNIVDFQSSWQQQHYLFALFPSILDPALPLICF